MRKPTPTTAFLVAIIALFPLFSVHAQTDSVAYVFQDAIENNVANNDDNAFSYDTEFEYLQDFIRHPLNINKASQTDFEQLKLLTADQIKAILKHRNLRKPFITLYELQAVIDLTTIRHILPFVYVDSDVNDFQIPVREWFKRGKNDLISRIEHRFETAKGFEKPDTEGGYLGDKNRLYLRYRYSFGNRLSYGITLDKDAGEPYGKSVFDFFSFHFKISDIHKTLKTICLGDYSVALGQGLIHENGFNIGKSAMALNVEKSNPSLSHYTSSNESNFLRGAAVGLRFAQNTEGVLFASYRQRDGNLMASQVENNPDKSLVISTLQLGGLHRTNNEIADKNAVGLVTLGGKVQRVLRGGMVALNLVYNHFDRTIEPQNKPYNLFTFRGRQLLNISTDFKFTYKNFHFFGETAFSDNGGVGTLNSVIIGLDKKLSLTILHRFFSLKYQAINAQPFAESARANDENGFYVGLEYKPNRTWTVNAYSDLWQYQWLRSRANGASIGSEYFLRIAFKTKNTEGYLQLKTKAKTENGDRPDSSKTNVLIDKTRSQLRFHFQYKISKGLELRNRLEWSQYEDETLSNGFMVYQDVLFSPPQYPVDISVRAAFFDTNSYQSAIYAFENDLMYNFTILPYYYQGSRFYVNISYKGIKNLLLELRLARTYLANQKTISSGLDEIEGNHRTDFKAQMRFSF